MYISLVREFENLCDMTYDAIAWEQVSRNPLKKWKYNRIELWGEFAMIVLIKKFVRSHIFQEDRVFDGLASFGIGLARCV